MAVRGPIRKGHVRRLVEIFSGKNTNQTDKVGNLVRKVTIGQGKLTIPDTSRNGLIFAAKPCRVVHSVDGRGDRYLLEAQEAARQYLTRVLPRLIQNVPPLTTQKIARMLLIKKIEQLGDAATIKDLSVKEREVFKQYIEDIREQFSRNDEKKGLSPEEKKVLSLHAKTFDYEDGIQKAKECWKKRAEQVQRSVDRCNEEIKKQNRKREETYGLLPEKYQQALLKPTEKDLKRMLAPPFVGRCGPIRQAVRRYVKVNREIMGDKLAKGEMRELEKRNFILNKQHIIERTLLTRCEKSVNEGLGEQFAEQFEVRVMQSVNRGAETCLKTWVLFKKPGKNERSTTVRWCGPDNVIEGAHGQGKIVVGQFAGSISFQPNPKSNEVFGGYPTTEARQAMKSLKTFGPPALKVRKDRSVAPDLRGQELWALLVRALGGGPVYPITLEHFRPLVRDVDTLHRRGFMHGDIKPKNMLIGENIADFGFMAKYERPQCVKLIDCDGISSMSGSKDFMCTAGYVPFDLMRGWVRWRDKDNANGKHYARTAVFLMEQHALLFSILEVLLLTDSELPLESAVAVNKWLREVCANHDDANRKDCAIPCSKYVLDNSAPQEVQKLIQDRLKTIIKKEYLGDVQRLLRSPLEYSYECYRDTKESKQLPPRLSEMLKFTPLKGDHPFPPLQQEIRACA